MEEAPPRSLGRKSKSMSNWSSCWGDIKASSRNRLRGKSPEPCKKYQYFQLSTNKQYQFQYCQDTWSKNSFTGPLCHLKGKQKNGFWDSLVAVPKIGVRDLVAVSIPVCDWGTAYRRELWLWCGKEWLGAWFTGYQPCLCHRTLSTLPSNLSPKGHGPHLLQTSIYFLPTIIYLHLTLEVLEANKSWDYLPRKIFLVERVYHNPEETLIVWIPTNLGYSMAEILQAAQSQGVQCD